MTAAVSQPTLAPPPLQQAVTVGARKWKQVALGAIVGGVLFGAASFLISPRYVARTTFTPEVGGGALSGGLAGLAGLAGSLGVGGAALAQQGPDLFVALLSSREVLEGVLATPYPTPDPQGMGARPLVDLLEIEEEDPRRRRDASLKALRRRIDVNVDRRTGVVTLDVAMRSPDLAADVANSLVAKVNAFNLERRHLQSRAQREFLADRVATARAELRRAEEIQLAFLKGNRVYNSPQLAIDAARLERDVASKQALYSDLVKSFEEARISELRDTPVLSVIDPAVPPALPRSPRKSLNAMLGLVVGALGMFLLLAAPEYRAAAARERLRLH